MRKALAVVCAATTLTFAGAGIANAFDDQPSSTTTTVADSDNGRRDDNTGLWGLTGLLGLAGLAGLARRRNNDVAVHPGATHRPSA